MPAEPLYQQVADPGSVVPFGAEIEAANPSGWPGYDRLLQRAVQREERALEARFGASFIAYKHLVPRWLGRRRL